MKDKLLRGITYWFAILLILAGGISVTSLLSMYQLNNYYNDFINEDLEIRHLSTKIKTDILLASSLNKAFLRGLEIEGFETAYENYIVPHNEMIISLENDLQALSNLLAHHEDAEQAALLADLETIEQSLKDYEDSFNEMLELVELRGTTESGLEAQFRARADTVGHLINNHPDEIELQNSYLALRVEENYLMHRSLENASTVDQMYKTLFRMVEEHDLPRHEKSEIAYELEFYDNEFLRVAVLDQNIARHHADIEATVDHILDTAGHISRLSQRTVTIKQLEANVGTEYLISNIAIIILIIIIVGIFLVYSLRRKLHQFNQ